MMQILFIFAAVYLLAAPTAHADTTVGGSRFTFKLPADGVETRAQDAAAPPPHPRVQQFFERANHLTTVDHNIAVAIMSEAPPTTREEEGRLLVARIPTGVTILAGEHLDRDNAVSPGEWTESANKGVRIRGIIELQTFERAMQGYMASQRVKLGALSFTARSVKLHALGRELVLRITLAHGPTEIGTLTLRGAPVFVRDGGSLTMRLPDLVAEFQGLIELPPAVIEQLQQSLRQKQLWKMETDLNSVAKKMKETLTRFAGDGATVEVGLLEDITAEVLEQRLVVHSSTDVTITYAPPATPASTSETVP